VVRVRRASEGQCTRRCSCRLGCGEAEGNGAGAGGGGEDGAARGNEEPEEEELGPGVGRGECRPSEDGKDEVDRPRWGAPVKDSGRRPKLSTVELLLLIGGAPQCSLGLLSVGIEANISVTGPPPP
jgi:hypothetical protein